MRLPKIGRAELGVVAASLVFSLLILELGLRWIAGIAPLFFAAPEERIDYIHLSPEGHRVAAAWLADQLAPP